MMAAMTARRAAPRAASTSRLELDRADLLPGRLVDGTLRITARDDGEIRGARVTLVGTETLALRLGPRRTPRATPDRDRRPARRTCRPSRSRSSGSTRFARRRVARRPVPAARAVLGPPTFDGTEFGLDWQVRVNLDVPGFDPILVMPVRVHQPTALLRAGVVRVAEFALYPEADAEAEGFAGSVLAGSDRRSASVRRSRAGSTLRPRRHARSRRCGSNFGVEASRR